MTLIEILSALIILSILFALMFTNWHHLTEKNNANITVTQIVRAMNLARSEAIYGGEDVIFCGSANKNTCDGNWAKGQIIKQGVNVLHVFKKIPGVGKLSWSGFPSKDYLKISSQGILETHNGTFKYRSKNNDARYKRSIVVNKGGRCRLV